VDLTLTRDEAEAIIYGSFVQDRLIDHSRWAVTHEIVFMREGKFYRFTYRVGATEYQDQDFFNYAKEVVCREVQPVLVIDYAIVKPSMLRRGM